MDDYGKAMDEQTVRIERLLPGPIERVWLYLTDAEKRSQWLAGGTMELRVGGRVRLEFLHSSLTPHQEVIPDRFQAMECGIGFDGTITQLEPPRLLAYTWGGNTSEVKFELSEQGGKVKLVITHTRLRDRNEQILVATGWHTHLGILQDRLSQQVPRPFWSTFAEAEAVYLQRFSASFPGARLMLTHHFDVAPEIVFDTLTNLASIRKCWPDETQIEMDVRVGGRWTIRLRDGEATSTTTGIYLEINPPSHLKSTYSMSQFSPDSDLISVDVEAEGSGSLVILEQAGPDIANELSRLQPNSTSATEQGWRRRFELMAEAWAKQNTPDAVRVVRRFAHAPEKVFDAWLDPVIARKFLFATDTGEIVCCELDARVGGKFTITDRRNGEEVEHTGDYLVIDRPTRLQFRFAVPKYSSEYGLVTIEIKPEAGGCELTLIAERVLPEFVERTRNGWTKLLQGLDGQLESLATPAE